MKNIFNKNQLSGIELLIAGESPGRVAKAVGVSKQAVLNWLEKPDFDKAVRDGRIALAKNSLNIISSIEDIKPTDSKNHIPGVSCELKANSVEDLRRYALQIYESIMLKALGHNIGPISPVAKAVADKILTRTGDLKPNPPKVEVEKVEFYIDDNVIPVNQPYLKTVVSQSEVMQNLREFQDDFDLKAGSA